MENINQNNMAFFDMLSANDLYEKLKYDFNLLNDEKSNVYDYINFIFTANHLKEWIEKDKKFDPSKKNMCNNIFNTKSNGEYSTIKSLCNRSKHFLLDNTEYEKDKVKNLGFDFTNFSFSNFTFKGPTYLVEVNNNMEELYKVCKKIFEDYKSIFEINFIK